MEIQKRECTQRFNSLMSEYKKWEAAHKELSTYINPIRGQFVATNTRGKMLNHQILLDSHAVGANRVLASGMQSGMTSPYRPWFHIRLANKEANVIQTVKEWLDEVTNRMREVCNSSNVYDVFYSMYEELGQFGTACAIVLEDFYKTIHLRVFTAGEYALGMDDRGVVNAFAREYEMTVGQVISAFGEENVSGQVLSAYKNNRVDQPVIIRHLIEPNDKADLSLLDNTNMMFRSTYWEKAENNEKFLDKTGFPEFPIIAPRWDTVTTNVAYGYGPGWFAVGDVKQLQKTVLDMLMAQEKLHNPPMQEDSSVTGISNYLPGGRTKTTGTTPNAGVRPAYQIDPRLDSFIQSIQNLHDRIDAHFYVNIFRMMTTYDKTNMTATEVAQREQENVMMMGPLLNRVNSEMLGVFLERLFAVMDRNGLFPEPPEEIQGQDLKIEFVSILAQAQKAITGVSIDRTLARVQNIAQVKPDVLDVFNFDEVAREYADIEGVPARLIVDEQVIAAIREQRAQAEQMMQMGEMANQGADVAKKLSDAKTDEKSILTRAIGI
jgi:hypothetical protein